MVFKISIICLYLNVCIYFHITEITQSPVSQNVSSGTVVFFTCVANCSLYIDWYYNNCSAVSDEKYTKGMRDRLTNLRNSTLTITSSQENNGFQYYCIAHNADTSHTLSAKATLDVLQGIH